MASTCLEEYFRYFSSETVNSDECRVNPILTGVLRQSDSPISIILPLLFRFRGYFDGGSVNAALARLNNELDKYHQLENIESEFKEKNAVQHHLISPVQGITLIRKQILGLAISDGVVPHFYSKSSALEGHMIFDLHRYSLHMARVALDWILERSSTSSNCIDLRIITGRGKGTCNFENQCKTAESESSNPASSTNFDNLNSEFVKHNSPPEILKFHNSSFASVPVIPSLNTLDSNDRSTLRYSKIRQYIFDILTHNEEFELSSIEVNHGIIAIRKRS